jgi:micrococcal nuclease
VADVQGRFFLNFGSDYKKDFTGAISPKDARSFASAGLDIKSLEGKKVRLRGWIYERNGPAMDLTHPEQVESLQNGGLRGGLR